MFKIMSSSKISKILFVLITLLFVSGCTNSESKPKQRDKQKEVIKTAPSSARRVFNDNNTAEKYQKCKRRGYEIIKKFDPQVKKTRTYCKFNGSACLLDQFVTGQCGPGKNSISLPQEQEEDRPIKCKQYNPVCGENNHTYANRCLARQAEVEISHPGYCDKKVAIQTNNTNKKVETPKANQPEEDKNNQQQKTKETKLPNWVNIIISLSQSEDPAYVKECSMEDRTFYYQKLNQGIDTVYNKKGKIVCNPNRDFNNSCPKKLQLNNSVCSTVWSS